MSIFCNNEIKRITSISPGVAKKYLLHRGYFSENKLYPGFINPRGLVKCELKPLDWNKPQSISRTIPIKIVSNKPRKGIREFSIIHPYSYLHIVNLITEKTNWRDIVEKLARKTEVNVYSLPVFDESENKPTRWEYFKTIDPGKFRLSHPIVAYADIQDFYNSLYTHSIAWTLLGKDVAKQNRGYELYPNKLDKLLQNANDGQTNGIATGNAISDIIAELTLKVIDEKLSTYIVQNNIKAFRYRDDYIFLGKNKLAAKRTIDYFASLIHNEYGLSLNYSKTPSSDHKLAAYEAWHSLTELVEGTDPVDLSGKKIWDFFSRAALVSEYFNDSFEFDALIRLFNKQYKNKIITMDESTIAWTEPTIKLICEQVSHNKISTTQVYALIDLFTGMLSDETGRDILLEIKDTSSSGTLRTTWMYFMLLRYPELAEAYLTVKDDELSQMIKNKTTPNARYFKTRDSISSSDKKELDKFQLIDYEKLRKVEEADGILDGLEPEELKTWSRMHYDV